LGHDQLDESDERFRDAAISHGNIVWIGRAKIAQILGNV
jgi:hypothetical protein